MRKIVLLLLELSAAALLAACAGVGRVPPVAVEPAAPRTPEPGNYAAIVQSRQWVLSTGSGSYDCGPLGVYVDANGSYQDAMRAVLMGALERVTFVSTVLTPDQMKDQGFDAQIVVSQGAADADLIGLPLPGRTARSDVSLAVTVAVRDQRGAVAQKTVVGYGRGKGEGVDCRQIVAAIGDAAQTAIGTIARQSATYVAGTLRDRRVARAAPAPQPAPPPPKPVVQAEPPKREAPESVHDTVRGAMAAGAVAAAPAEAASSQPNDAVPQPVKTAKASESVTAEKPGARDGTVSGSAGTAPKQVTPTSADDSVDARSNSSPAASPPAPEAPVVVETQDGNAALSANNDDAAAQGEVSDDKAPGAVEQPPRAETVALATPRVAPLPPSGSITAEEAFVRGANAAAGRGVAKSDAEALKWYRIAAAMGYAPAQNNLGFMYAEGRGVPRDDAEAVKWYKRAAAQKYPPAETGLGMMYSAGRGVKQSDFEALALYSSAANQGYGQAKANLAAMFGDGRGVARDIMTATFLLGSVRERPYTGSGIYVEPPLEKRANDGAQAQSSATGSSADQGQ